MAGIALALDEYNFFELVVDKIFYGQPKSIFLVPNLDFSIQDSGTWDLGWTLIGNLTQGWDYNNNVPETMFSFLNRIACILD